MNSKKKIALITGASSGLGKATAIKLAGAGFHIVLAGRSEEKNQIVINEINSSVGQNSCEWLPLDLKSLLSVKNCADLFLKSNRDSLQLQLNLIVLRLRQDLEVVLAAEKNTLRNLMNWNTAFEYCPAEQLNYHFQSAVVYQQKSSDQ